jgi:hypothetical protein
LYDKFQNFNSLQNIRVHNQRGWDGMNE